VKYQIPTDEGDAQVTGYYIQRRLAAVGGDGGWETVNVEPTTALVLVVGDLKPLTEYQFRVVAENEHGIGDYSSPSKSVKCLPDEEDEWNLAGARLRRYVTR